MPPSLRWAVTLIPAIHLGKDREISPLQRRALATLTISGQGRDLLWELLEQSLLTSPYSWAIPGFQFLSQTGQESRIPNPHTCTHFILLPPSAPKIKSELVNLAFKAFHLVNSRMQVSDEELPIENLECSRQTAI